jgi:hypothetical protein
MDFRNTMISDMFPTTSVYYDLDSVKKLDESKAIESPVGCLTWISEKPPVIMAMDKTLRRSFKVPDNSKMVFRLYKPPEFGFKEPMITKPGKKMSQRVLISTIAESPSIVFGNKTQLFKMKQGEAYSIPYPVNNMVNIQFDDKKTLIIPARKGFRQQKRTKRVEKRYIMIFDYVYTDEIHEAVDELVSSS